MSACTAVDPQLPADQHPVHVAAKAPPPVSGGTLRVTQQGYAVAADSDRDRVMVVDLATHKVSRIALEDGDEPGRVIEDGDGRIHVALRGGGAVATIDPAAGKVLRRDPVCPAPRGLAFDSVADVVHVACAGGELVTLPAAGGAAVRSIRLDRDLRDVIVKGDTLLVSRFRSAELLVVDKTGKTIKRQTPPGVDNTFVGGPEGEGIPPKDDGTTPAFIATVAWRTISLPGGAAIIHQRSATIPVQTQAPDGYSSGGDGCGDGIVNSALTTVDDEGNLSNPLAAPSIVGASVPVDLATTDGDHFGVVSAGGDQVFFVRAATLSQEVGGGCATPDGQVSVPGGPVAIDSFKGSWVVQTRQPASLAIFEHGSIARTIDLGGDDVEDTGHYLFHHNASPTSALACASCHPEGHDDSHTWVFDTSGPRRTQNVSGGVLATAPLHWDGDMNDLGMIMQTVFVHRMGGAQQGPRHVDAFGGWMDSIKAMPASPTGSAASIAHGKELFDDATVGCATCHSGQHLTDNTNRDVGTGRAFQVPTLVGIAARAPFLHDGCAPTLLDRFDPTKASCNGGDKHGQTSQLSSDDIADLVAYLESL